MGMIFTDEGLRAMYAGGRADKTARRLARLWAAVFARGLLPERWVTLEVTGRRSGRPTRFPLGMADWQGGWYLVPMLGGECNWVRNVRAAGGRATLLLRRRPVPCRLAEVPVSERARLHSPQQTMGAVAAGPSVMTADQPARDRRQRRGWTRRGPRRPGRPAGGMPRQPGRTPPAGATVPRAWPSPGSARTRWP